MVWNALLFTILIQLPISKIIKIPYVGDKKQYYICKVIAKETSGIMKGGDIHECERNHE